MAPRILSAALSCVRFSRYRIHQHVVLLLAVLGLGAIALAQTTTTTTLAVSPSTSPLPPQTTVTLTATVMAGATPVPKGLVTFCDTSIPAVPACSGLAVVGKEQLQAGGGKDGIADVRIIPGGGSHSYIAVFAGTKTYATSTSAPQTITVLYRTTSSIASSGSVGNYTLTGTVAGIGSFTLGPTGNVSFVDTTIGNFVLGMAPLGSSTIAQSFVNAPVIPVGANPVSAAVGDFNGDGIPDLAVVNRDDDNVSILLGNGSGGFSAATGSPISVGGVPVSIAVGDFNGDGITDLAVVNNGPNNVTILLGNGSGGFSEGTGSPVPVGNHPVAVAVADFNGDGIPDLSVVNGGTSDVSILLGDGSGGFSAATGSPIPVGSNPAAVAVGDFNKDGIADLAVVNNGPNNVSILLGNGSGGFSQATGSPIPVGNDPVAVAAGDFNGDGVADLAVVNGGPNNVSILLGDGSGGFSAAGSPVPVGSSPVAVSVGDFNGDGAADLAVVNNGPDNVSILLGNGSGGFSDAPGSPISVGTGPKNIALADFNGDGVTDLTVTSGDLNNLSTVLNQVIQTATATLPGVSVPGTGTHDVNATYPGDANFDASTSATIPLIASSSVTTLALSTTPASSTYGQPVVLTATLSPYSEGSLTTDGDIVTFTINGSSLGSGTLRSGVATLTTTALPIGVSTLQANFAGDANFLSSVSSPLSFTVSKSTPGIGGVAPVTVTSSLNPSTYNQSVTFTATVPIGATGTVIFADNGTAISGVVTITGTSATFTTSTLFGGTRQISAVYSGDGNYNGATSASLSQVVNPLGTSTALTVSPSSSPLAPQTVVTLTATVMAGATAVQPGLVTFCDTSINAVPTCSGLAVVGTAQLTSSGSAVLRLVPGGGGHSYIAVFAGTTGYVTSGSASQIVTVSWPTTTAIASSGSAGSYTLIATVHNANSHNPSTGSVSFADTSNGNFVLGTAPLGTPTFTQNFTVGPGSPISTGVGAYAIATGDFNRDGFADLAVTNANGANVTILLGTGSGGFSPAPGSPVAVGSVPRSIAIADFNGDGIADLVVANASTSGTVGVLLGNGAGSFTAASGSPITVGSSPAEVVTADFNGDGLADLAVVNRGSNSVSILLGNGNGTFTPAASPGGVYNAPSSVAVGDFNGDGKADLAVTNATTNNVNILLGDGDGTFALAPGSPFPVGSNPTALAVGDFNGDGKQDLGIANANGGSVSVLIGNGNGSFTSAAALPVGGNPVGVAVADFNGDGVPDLAISDGSGTNVKLWQGRGDGTFVAASPITIFNGPIGLVVGDFNGDGIADVAAANNFGSNVSFALSNVTQTATATLIGVSIPGSGTHDVNATYQGNTNFSASTSPTTPLTASPVATTLTLSASPTSSSYGQPVVLTATLSPYSDGSLTTDGDTVNFTINGNPLGSGTLRAGVATISTTALPAGISTLQVRFSGDANFLASVSSPLSFIVSKSTPGVGGVAPVTVASSLNPSIYGQNVTFTATVPNGATGAVTFADNGTAISGAVTITGITAMFTTSALLVGTHPISAVYSGDGNYNGTTSASLTQVVNQLGTSTALTANPSTVMYGDTTTLTAVVSPAGTTGTVTFAATPTGGGAAITLGTSAVTGTGTAAWSESALAAGVYAVVAHYNGDQNFGASSSLPAQQTVTKRTGAGSGGAALTVTANDASRTTTETNPQFSYTISGTLVNGDTYGTAVTGTPTYTAYTGSTPGSYPIAVTGLTSANYVIGFVAGTLTVVSTPSTTTLTASPNSPQYGDLVTLTATVSPAAVSGTVSFYDGTVYLGAGTVTSGVATLTTPLLTAGTHSIKAIYNGDGTYASSTSSPTTLVVAKKTGTGPGGAALTVTVENASREFGEANPEFVYVVSGTLVNGDTYATAVTGVPMYSVADTPTSPPGSTFPITVSGLVSQNYVLGSVPGTLTIVPAVTTTTLSTSATSVLYGNPVTLTATVAPGATGTVDFVSGFNVLGQGTLSGGVATLTTTTLRAATYVVTAIYLGDGNYSSGTSGPVTLIVSKRTGSGPNGAALTVTVNNASRSYGQGNPAFTYTVTGTLVNNDSYATAVTGIPVYLTPATVTSPVGSYPVSVNSLSSANYELAFVNGTLTVTKGTPAVPLSSPSNPSTYSSSVTFTTILSAGASGTVTFLDGTTTLCSGVVITAATATCTTSTLSPGTHSITAQYGGDSNYNSATSPVLSQTVTKATLGSGGVSPVTLASSSNPSVAGTPVTFTATVPAGATGIVTFLDGTTALGTGTISGGKATYATSTLAVVTHSITAAYGGDSNYNGATSAVLSQVIFSPATISGPDFTVSSSTGRQLIPPGASASYNIVVSSVNAPFTSSVTMGASSLPPGATYTFSPAAVTPGAAGANTTFTVSVPQQSAALHTGRLGPPALALLLLPFAWLRRSRGSPYRLLLWMLVALGSLGAMSGCGAGGYFSQPEQTYTITITGTSGTLVHNTTVALTVE